jgi:hypothetical protein
VITGPEEGAAAGRGRLRASHADREHVIDTFKTAFADGRLDKDELDVRVGPGTRRADLRGTHHGHHRHPRHRGYGPAAASACAAAGEQGNSQVEPHRRGSNAPARHVRHCTLRRPVARFPVLPTAVHRVDRCDHRGHHADQEAHRSLARVSRSAATTAWAGRPGRGSRASRRHQPCAGSPRNRHHPDPHQPAGRPVPAGPGRALAGTVSRCLRQARAGHGLSRCHLTLNVLPPGARSLHSAHPCSCRPRSLSLTRHVPALYRWRLASIWSKSPRALRTPPPPDHCHIRAWELELVTPPKNWAQPPDFRHQPRGASDRFAVSGS